MFLIFSSPVHAALICSMAAAGALEIEFGWGENGAGLKTDTWLAFV
jgi:hypothetical protein